MTLNVLEAVHAEAPDTAVLLTGSGEVYGPPARLPVDEDAPLRPQKPLCRLEGGMRTANNREAFVLHTNPGSAARA